MKENGFTRKKKKINEVKSNQTHNGAFTRAQVEISVVYSAS